MAKGDTFRDVYIMPDLTRKQAERERFLRWKLKEIKMNSQDNDALIRIDKGRIVAGIMGQERVIFDPEV